MEQLPKTECQALAGSPQGSGSVVSGTGKSRPVPCGCQGWEGSAVQGVWGPHPGVVLLGVSGCSWTPDEMYAQHPFCFVCFVFLIATLGLSCSMQDL